MEDRLLELMMDHIESINRHIDAVENAVNMLLEELDNKDRKILELETKLRAANG